MDHRAAGEVDGALGPHNIEETIAGPDPVAKRGVHQENPKDDENDPALEADALGNGTGNQSRGDDGKLAWNIAKTYSGTPAGKMESSRPRMNRYLLLQPTKPPKAFGPKAMP